MSTSYSKYSPYYSTDQGFGYLNVWNSITFPKLPDDILFTVTKSYEHRPDLLAYDLYGQVNLWWVFAVRNKDVIKDSIYDFIPGQTIFLPKLSTIKKILGS